MRKELTVIPRPHTDPVNTTVDPRTQWPPRSSRFSPGDTRDIRRIEVLVSGEPRWASNDLRFLDDAEALTFARGLCDRWSIIRKIRVVPEEWPMGQAYLPGSEHPQWQVSA